MSLDDAAPTQHFGADPVTFTAIGAGNGTVQMTQERARRLIAEGVPEYKFTGLLPAVEMRNAADEVCLRTTEEDTGHRQGCAFGRTARCTCMYLIQWDKTPEYTAPTWPVADTLFDDKGEAEKLFKDPGHLTPLALELSDEKLRSKYWYGEYKSLRRGYLWALGFAAFNGACLAVAVWQLVNR